MIAGEGRACTSIMRALPSRLFVKVGAEGVYTACIPEKGLGIAMKARDGSYRAAEVAVVAIASKHMELSEAELQALQPLINPVLRNWNGLEIGSIRFAG